MAAFIFNVAKGRFVHYATLPEANDAFVWVLLQSAGLEADATLRDYDDLAALLAATNDEATFTGYSRVTATGVTVTVDDTNEWVSVDAADPSWSPTSAQALGKILLCYDPDTTGGTDAQIVPVFADDFVMTTPTSGTITYQVNAAGWARAREP